MIKKFPSFNIQGKTVRKIPTEDFFRNSEKTGFQLSPDGRHISYMAPYEKRLNLFVQPTNGTESIRITSETERSIAGYMWANSNRLLFLKDSGGDENYQLYGVNLDGSNLKAYTAIPGVRTHIIDELPDIDSMVIIGTNQRNPQIFDPYRLNLETGEMTLLAENPGNIQGWMTDHDGKLRAATAIVDGVNTQILYRNTEAESFRVVLTTNFREEVSFVDFTPDNKQVYAITNLGRDKTELVLMDPATCTELEPLYKSDKYDISGVNYSEAKKKLTHAAYLGHKDLVRHFFDDDTKKLYENIQNKIPGCCFGITSCNKAENMFIITVYSDRNPGTYYLYEAQTDSLKKITETRPWIKEEEMADMIPVTYPTRDGLTLEAYLTLPAGKTLEEARNMPVIINPHGGPWARDTWGYNTEAQFLANRGYAVFQMNFRGSTGYGRKFLESSYKQWGQSMQDDITDGAKWLIKQGIADPGRIAIYGGSYGGYATLQGITGTPDLYCCAVDYVGVSNLFTFMNTIPPYWKPMMEMMYEMVGDPQKDKVMMEANSPVFHADRIRVPLFIAQGANDPRVNKAESNQMVEALRKRGIEVEYMVKDNEGHGFSNEENRLDFYRAMESFFAKNLK